MEFEASRARGYYREALPLLDMVDPEGRAMLSAIIDIYYTLLERIEAQGYEVLAARVRVSTARKLWILARNGINPRPRPALRTA